MKLILMNISKTFFKSLKGLSDQNLTRICSSCVQLRRLDVLSIFALSRMKNVSIINPAMIYFHFTVGVRDWATKPLTGGQPVRRLRVFAHALPHRTHNLLYYNHACNCSCYDVMEASCWQHTWNIKCIFVSSTLRISTLSLFQLTNEQIIKIIAQMCVLRHVFTEFSTRNQHWSPCWCSLSRATVLS